MIPKVKNDRFPKKEAIRLTIFWQKFGPNTYPIDIKGLIAGVVNDSDFRGQLYVEVGRFDSFEGCLKRIERSDDWIILLNSNIENERRFRFTFAHELGHFMCHRKLKDHFEDGEGTLNDFDTQTEREANIFAAWLLIPPNLLCEEFPDSAWNTEVLCRVGNRFESSLQSSAIRFVDLSNKPIAFVVSRDGMVLWAKKNKKTPFMHSFRFGDGLPSETQALACHLDRSLISSPTDTGYSWSNSMQCSESQYFDYSGRGYQYTCIEFFE